MQTLPYSLIDFFLVAVLYERHIFALLWKFIYFIISVVLVGLEKVSQEKKNSLTYKFALMAEMH